MARKSDNKEVKDALQAKDIEILNKSIADLNVIIKDGFAGVHSRQDQTNGKVLKAGDDINSLRSKFEYNRIIWYMLTVSISLIIALSSFILFK